jgi:hypothetical protein
VLLDKLESAVEPSQYSGIVSSLRESYPGFFEKVTAPLQNKKPGGED